MIKKMMKFFLVTISLAVIARLFLSNDKTMMSYACIALFSIPLVYTQDNNIVIWSKVLENKVSMLFSKNE